MSRKFSRREIFTNVREYKDGILREIFTKDDISCCLKSDDFWSPKSGDFWSPKSDVFWGPESVVFWNSKSGDFWSSKSDVFWRSMFETLLETFLSKILRKPAKGYDGTIFGTISVYGLIWIFCLTKLDGTMMGRLMGRLGITIAGTILVVDGTIFK